MLPCVVETRLGRCVCEGQCAESNARTTHTGSGIPSPDSTASLQTVV